MRKIIDRYHQKAIAQKIKIVHSCGFDSIPSDFGTLKVQKAFYKKYGYFANMVSIRVKDFKGAMSGGTYISMSNVIGEAEKDKSIQNLLSNNYSLNPDPLYSGVGEYDLKSVKKDKITEQWICPFIMATINTRVVRRSHALMGFPYGHDFKYEEALLCGNGFIGRLKAIFIRLGLGMLMAAKPGTLLKTTFDWLMPKPGEGPDEQSRNAGYFKYLIFAQGLQGDQTVVEVHGDKDPGYGCTSKMLAESAVDLIFDEQLPEIYGVLTPSVALGDNFFMRLEKKAGITFKVIEQK